MAGDWTNLDDATWRACTAFGFLILFPLVTELLLRAKRGLVWVFACTGVLFNVIRLILNAYYCETLFLYGYDYASGYYIYYKSFETLCYIASGFSLYYRKKMICPSQSIWDMLNIAVVIGFHFGSLFTCVASQSGGSLEICWSYGDLLTGAGLLVSCLYFDIYYSIFIYQLYDGKKNWNELFDLMLLALQTGTNSIIIMVGVTTYTLGFANFYTNALWNFVVVSAPIVALQSVISPKVAKFISKKLALQRHHVNGLSELTNSHNLTTHAAQQ
jgi:hypothetical protein